MIAFGPMLKRAAEQEDKKKQLSSSEAAAIALSPLPVKILGGALSSGGSSSDKSLLNELIRLGRREGIEFRDYPQETLLKKILRIGSGEFRTGASLKVPPRTMTREQAKTPYPGPEKGLTWGDVVGKKIVWKPGSPGMLSHEMGHLKEKHSPVLQVAELTVPLAGLGLGTLGALAAKTPESAERMGQIGAALAAGISVPGLYRELAASLRGLSTMRRAGATTGQLVGQGLSKMAPAFLASAAKASMIPIASIVASKLIARAKAKKEATK